MFLTVLKIKLRLAHVKRVFYQGAIASALSHLFLFCLWIHAYYTKAIFFIVFWSLEIPWLMGQGLSPELCGS